MEPNNDATVSRKRPFDPSLEALLPDRWVAARPEHRLEQREEESREAQARRRRKRAAPGRYVILAVGFSGNYRIARDKASVQWRKHRPEHPLEVSDLVEEPSCGDEFDHEDALEIHAALDRLAPEHREILVLRFLEDMTYEPIAKVTGCPIGTVRSRLYYAKSALHGAIEQS